MHNVFLGITFAGALVLVFLSYRTSEDNRVIVA
ncbi:hypothetical protein ABIB68_004255 [Bradyrhizobium sp. F1.2.2]|jgi:hypothetical protein